jgi:uroporphyrinogen-III synthase
MEAKPRLLLTRPEAAARRFLAACEAEAGHRLSAILSPVMAIRPMEVHITGTPAALILTSENGAERAGELGLPPLEAWCVGARTAEVARAQGFVAREVGPDAEALLGVLLARRPPGLLLHLRGEHARGDLARRLREGGLDAAEAVAYRQEALPPALGAREALAGPGPLVVPLFSPRSATLLAGWSPRAPLHVLAMSEVIAVEAAARLHPEHLTTLTAPSGPAMVAATLGRLQELADGVP